MPRCKNLTSRIDQETGRTSIFAGLLYRHHLGEPAGWQHFPERLGRLGFVVVLEPQPVHFARANPKQSNPQVRYRRNSSSRCRLIGRSHWSCSASQLSRCGAIACETPGNQKGSRSKLMGPDFCRSASEHDLSDHLHLAVAICPSLPAECHQALTLFSKAQGPQSPTKSPS